MGKKKASQKNQVAAVVDDPNTPPPSPGADGLVDPSELIVSPDKKKLNELVGSLDIETEASRRSLLSLINVSDETVTKLNDAVTVEMGKSPELADALDKNKDDISRARALEALSARDLAKGHVIGDGWMAAALEREDGEEAIKALMARQKTRMFLFDTMTHRKKMQLDDVASRNREIITETINELLKDLEACFKEESVDSALSDKILQRLADKVGLRFGDDESVT